MLYIANYSAAGAGMTNPMTTGGDIIYGGAAGTPTRLANGTAGQVLTSQGTTLAPIWSTAGVGDMVLASVQTNSGAKTFLNNTLLQRNPANTFSYTITAAAIAADRVLTLPLITATDTIAVLGLAQTFTATQTFGTLVATTFNGNTITTGSSTFTGTAGQTYTFPSTTKTLAANDGSNFTMGSQATGDLVVASGATAVARLADVAVGQVLVSGGVGVAPSYSANPAVTTLELGAGSTDTTLSRSAAGVLAVEGVVIPSISSTNTLTNKRITRRVTTTNAPGATPTTNTDNVDVMNFTGLGTAITSMTTNLSGTPVDGDLIMFRFTDDGTARAITWGASFAATTVALPTTTVISTMLRVGFQYSGSTWKCIAVA